ncbi:MAG: alpha/beta hydrolase [Deltaproteobacteria bacterium]|jgi:fermentation-respiration switch protein FrsA (DUF1100 family)|nr:alpha/beta hydrolase [Deltaproteobacteria bacterium]
MGILTKGFYPRMRGGMEVKTLSPQKILLRVLVAVVVTAAVLLALAFVFKNSLLFFPTRGEMELSPERIGWKFESVFLDGLGGAKFNAWYLPQEDSGAKTVLLLHGNGGNLQEMIGRVISYHKMGLGVMAIDYNGFGLSEGSPSEEAMYQNAQASFAFLTEEKKIRPQDIVIHGFSIGGAAASHLALQNKEFHNPLILDSTFTRIQDAAASRGGILKLVAPLLLGDAMDTRARLAGLEPDILIVFHSPEDEVVPFALGLANYEAYQNGPKLMVTLKGEHMDYFLNQFAYEEVIFRNFGLKESAGAGEGEEFFVEGVAEDNGEGAESGGEF